MSFPTIANTLNNSQPAPMAVVRPDMTASRSGAPGHLRAMPDMVAPHVSHSHDTHLPYSDRRTLKFKLQPRKGATKLFDEDFTECLRIRGLTEAASEPQPPSLDTVIRQAPLMPAEQHQHLHNVIVQWQIVHTQGTGVVLVYVWRWSSHIEISGKRPIRSGLGIVV